MQYLRRENKKKYNNKKPNATQIIRIRIYTKQKVEIF